MTFYRGRRRKRSFAWSRDTGKINGRKKGRDNNKEGRTIFLQKGGNKKHENKEEGGRK